MEMPGTVIVLMFVHSIAHWSTLDDIKENVNIMTPKVAVKQVYDKAGGVMNIQSLSEVPRDRR